MNRTRILIVLFFLVIILGQPLCGTEVNNSNDCRVERLEVSASSGKIFITLAAFSQASFTFRIIDNAEEGKPRFRSLAVAMTLLGGVAGTNGGFFVQNPFTPFGLMVSGGVATGKFDSKSWMNGVLVVRGDRPSIEPSGSFVLEAAVTDALQAGPLLIRDGQVEMGLDQSRIANRTFIGHDETGHWVLGTTSKCSLHELALVLASEEVTAVIHVRAALNLDGGPSTGFWALENGQRLYKPERWPVRNYLGVFRRESGPDKPIIAR